MTELEAQRIVAGARGGLPELLQAVRAAPGDRVTIEIPPRSGLFLTASEFRSLKTTAEQVGVQVTIETDDRLRQQLAQMFNVGWTPLPKAEPVSEPEPRAAPDPSPWPERPRDTANGSRTEIHLPTSKPWRADVIDVSRETALPPPPSMTPEVLDDEDKAALRRRSVPRRRLALGAAMLVGLILLGLLGSIFLRTATLAVTLKRQTVSAPVTFGVRAEGFPEATDVPFVVDGETVTLEPRFTASRPVTGTITRQTKPASGTLELRNIGDAPVTIPAGTEIVTAEGVTYRTTAEASLGAGSTEEPTKGEVTVESVTGGNEANREQGKLFGKLEGFEGVYYGNLESAVGGGEGEVVPAVAPEDEQALVELAQQGLPTQAATTPLPDGRIVVPSTLQPAGELTYTLDHKAGEPASELRIDATMRYTGLAIDPRQVEAQAGASLQESLRAALPEGYELLPETIQLSPPEEPAEATPGEMQITATAEARAVLDENERDELRRLVSGLSQEEARERAQTLADVEAVEVDVRPDWLVKTLPVSGRIEVTTS